ncbi:hypothetical protein, partial [Salmonella enterica]|uniref:hypothetical protein n=1 Tax=Salmonella enterica TaxID=28901 RepID=UPI0020C5A8B6
CLIMRKKGIGFATASPKKLRAARRKSVRVRRSTAGKKMFSEENSKTTKKQGKWAPFPWRMQNKAAYRTAA